METPILASEDLIATLMKSMIAILVREPDGKSMIEESLQYALDAIAEIPIVRVEQGRVFH